MTKTKRGQEHKISAGAAAPKNRGKLPIDHKSLTTQEKRKARDQRGRFKAMHTVEISDARTDSRERDKALLASMKRRAKKIREEKAAPTLSLAELRAHEGKDTPEVSEAVEDTRHDEIAAQFAAAAEARAEEIREGGEEADS
jgi:hypothetical protein